MYERNFLSGIPVMTNVVSNTRKMPAFPYGQGGQSPVGILCQQSLVV